MGTTLGVFVNPKQSIGYSGGRPRPGEFDYRLEQPCCLHPEARDCLHDEEVCLVRYDTLGPSRPMTPGDPAKNQTPQEGRPTSRTTSLSTHHFGQDSTDMNRPSLANFGAAPSPQDSQTDRRIKRRHHRESTDQAPRYLRHLSANHRPPPLHNQRTIKNRIFVDPHGIRGASVCREEHAWAIDVAVGVAAGKRCESSMIPSTSSVPPPWVRPVLSSQCRLAPAGVGTGPDERLCGRAGLDARGDVPCPGPTVCR